VPELEGLDALIHLAGENIASARWTPAMRQRIETSRSVATRALAESLAALEQPPVAALCASASGIYGTRREGALDESAPAGDDFLAGVCSRWEAASEPLRARGVRVVSLRFGAVLDTGGGLLARLLPVFRLGLGGPLGSGRQFLSWISLVDALHAIRFLLESTTVSGSVNLVSPGVVTNAGFSRALGRALRRPAFLRIPAFALQFLFGEMAREILLGGVWTVPRVLTREGYRFHHPEIESFLREALNRSAVGPRTLERVYDGR
jgi:hypothetical protein